MPTTLELAGLAKPSAGGVPSLLPLLRGEQTESNYPAIYGAYLELQRSVTHDGWKLILYPKAQVARLYHVAADAQEMNDLASDPAQAERKQQLFARLVALQRQFGDPLDLSKAFPRCSASPRTQSL